MPKQKSILLQHSLFTEKPSIKTSEDLTKDKLEKFGDKIIVDIPLDKISSQPQVRQTFDQSNITELATDIDSKGLIHPITVMTHPSEENKYILLIGGNRFLAYKTLNKPSIPCIVKDYNKSSTTSELLQLAENMHRTDLNPIELANALGKIKEKTGYTLEKIAKAVGRNLDSIKQYSRISKLSQEEQTFHIEKKSTKNDILRYLAQKEKPNTPTELNTPLFETKELNSCSKLSHQELIEKINEAEAFLKIAKKTLKNK